MSVHYIAGKPGAGKGLWAVKMVVDELCLTDRHVCTNLPLRLDPLAAYIAKRTGSTDGMRRLRILNDSECLRFWEHYGVGCDVQGYVKYKSGDREIDVPDYSWRQNPENKFPGTLFVIDEVHIYFPSRGWNKTGSHALHYQSQHRHMGDDVVMISQYPGQCDRAMRELCQDFTWLTNLGKTTLFGFKFPGIGRRATFSNEEDKSPLETGTYRLNVSEYGPLYDTTAGAAGLIGRADIKEKAGKGMSPYLIPFFVIAFLAACWFLPKLFFKGVSAVTSHAVEGLGQVSSSMTTNLVKIPPASTGAVLRASQTLQVVKTTSPSSVSSAAISTNKPVKIVRRVIVGPSRTYWLSDGRKLTQGDGDIIFAGEDYIILNGGKVVWFDK